MIYSDTRVIWGPLDRALESLRENVKAARTAADVAAPRENGLTGNIREGESRQGEEVLRFSDASPGGVDTPRGLSLQKELI